MMKKNMEKELPGGYEQAFYMNAKSVKMGIVFNLVALVVLIAVMVLAIFFWGLYPDRTLMKEMDEVSNLAISSTFLLVMILYMILHELVHGIAYKALTGEKLTFGLSWSCAFCGVPSIYVYRKAAIISAAAPLVVFTVIMLLIMGVLYFTNVLIYFLGALVFGFHLGGCGGDFYLICLLLFKFKDKRTLVRDTGPEQFIYLPEEVRD